jgi:hypothetical protein
MFILMVCKFILHLMSNKLLEKVEYLLSHSDNVYKKTLQVAFLAKRKKNLEDLSGESSKENIILTCIDEVFDLTVSEGE